MRSAYEYLANHGLGHPCGIFNQLWQVKAFPNALTTAWRILMDKMPTRCNLIRRGVIASSSSCEMCRALEETSHHLFLECRFAQRVWSQCFRWIGILGAQHKDLKVHFENFHLVHMSCKQNLVWKGMWVAIVRVYGNRGMRLCLSKG